MSHSPPSVYYAHKLSATTQLYIYSFNNIQFNDLPAREEKL